MIEKVKHHYQLKADRPHPRNCRHTPTDYRHTDKHLRLVITLIALCCTRQRQAHNINRCVPEIWPWPWEHWRTDRRRDGCCQVHYLPASWSITSFITVRIGNVMFSKRLVLEWKNLKKKNKKINSNLAIEIFDCKIFGIIHWLHDNFHHYEFYYIIIPSALTSYNWMRKKGPANDCNWSHWCMLIGLDYLNNHMSNTMIIPG